MERPSYDRPPPNFLLRGYGQRSRTQFSEAARPLLFRCIPPPEATERAYSTWVSVPDHVQRIQGVLGHPGDVHEEVRNLRMNEENEHEVRAENTQATGTSTRCEQSRTPARRRCEP